MRFRVIRQFGIPRPPQVVPAFLAVSPVTPEARTKADRRSPVEASRSVGWGLLRAYASTLPVLAGQEALLVPQQDRLSSC